MDTLQKLYNSEIDFRLDTHWDAGITARLGNGYNGEYIEEATFSSVDLAIHWLEERALHYYPDSQFANKGDKNEQ